LYWCVGTENMIRPINSWKM